MTTQAISAFGTLLKIGDGATPETFTTILHVGNITAPAIKSETKDATAHDSTGGWKEFKPTLLSVGNVKFPVWYVPSAATHNATTGLLADVVNRTLRNFQIVYPGAVTWTFGAYVDEFAPKAPVDGLLTADITLTPTGVPTLA
jgi:predicted secreted protein